MIELHALCEKYREMKRLRTEHDAGAGGDPRPAMRALASRFPGALRELDELPIGVIDARLASLERALESGTPEPWMIELARYHAWMRLALRIRLACGRERTADTARARLACAAREHADDIDASSLDDVLLRDILRPPRGRLHDVVLARVARELEIEPSSIDAHLCSPHRRR